jgi:hypothetical protein
MPSKNLVQRKTEEYEARHAQRQRDREAFIAKHGQKAWDAKTEREINELYDVVDPFPTPREKP